jgi:hypothetical protein
MIKKSTLILFVAFTTSLGFAQKKPKDAVAPTSAINTDSIAVLILKNLNTVRTALNLDVLEFDDMLAKASMEQAEDMADRGKADLSNGPTGKRVVKAGGTTNAEELVISMATLKGKTSMTSAELADAIVKKWQSGKKEQALIVNGNFIYASPSIKLDESGKKAYVSVVLGSFNTFNKGAGKKKRKELAVRYTRKNKKIKPADEKACKNCEKFKDYEGLLKGLYVEENKVYLKYSNMKTFGQLISKPTDGLAFDIVQRAQYDKPEYNILDNNLLSKGILSKTVNKAKIASTNRIVSEKKGGKVSELDVCLGKLPKKTIENYEINLLIIQDGKVCKTLMKSYVEQGDQGSNTPLTMLMMPDSNAYFKPPFVPKSDSATLSFTVPFEKNKSEYKAEDMLPFLNSLQEPDFIINGLNIAAYSSIEGDSVSNAKLQKKRSESIIAALGKMQKQNTLSSVKTGDTWELFKMSVEGTKFDTLSKMSKQKAIQEINTKGLSAELEPYLSKQRFGEIKMQVIYDISGAKEEKFCVSKFNQAVKKGDIVKAYKIQYYIGKQVRENKYSPDVFSKMEIPSNAKTSGLLNNQIVLRYMANKYVAQNEDYDQLKKLTTLDPANSYVTFNSIFCALKFDNSIGDAKERAAIQTKIDDLYKANVPKKYVDALNIEWQFKVIEAVDTMSGSAPIIQACNDKIKSFYNLKESTWQNNLKLSYVFAKFKDYKYAANLLSDYVKQDRANEQLLFSYISYCAKVPELIKTHLFVTALQKAEKINHERYCKLFGEPFLTFQVLDNPFVKEDYVKAACK